MQMDKIERMIDLLKEIEKDYPDTKDKMSEIYSIIFINPRQLTKAEIAYGQTLKV